MNSSPTVCDTHVSNMCPLHPPNILGLLHLSSLGFLPLFIPRFLTSLLRLIPDHQQRTLHSIDINIRCSTGNTTVLQWPPICRNMDNSPLMFQSSSSHALAKILAGQHTSTIFSANTDRNHPYSHCQPPYTLVLPSGQALHIGHVNHCVLLFIKSAPAGPGPPCVGRLCSACTTSPFLFIGSSECGRRSLPPLRCSSLLTPNSLSMPLPSSQALEIDRHQHQLQLNIYESTQVLFIIFT